MLMITTPTTTTARLSAIVILLLPPAASSTAISSIIIIIRSRISSARIWHPSRGHSRSKHPLVRNLSWHHLLTHLRMETWSRSCLGVHHGRRTTAWRRIVSGIATRWDTTKSWLRHVLRWLLLLLLLLTTFGSLPRRCFPSGRWHCPIWRSGILLRHHRYWHHS